jgi:hypothetical protein
VCNSLRGHMPHFGFTDLGEAIRSSVWEPDIVAVMAIGQ